MIMQAQAKAIDNPFFNTPFSNAFQLFCNLVSILMSEEMCRKEHSEVESFMRPDGFELLREMLQGHYDWRGGKEVKQEVVDADGIKRSNVRQGERDLESIFGTVVVGRLNYFKKGKNGLHPLDAELNLPTDLYSHGVRRMVAEQVAKESYHEVVNTVATMSGASVGNLQVAELTEKAATDFDAFYQQRNAVKPAEVKKTGGILVITGDGKGVVMRVQDLREATRKAAQAQPIDKDVNRTEKKNYKRMATVASVYTIEPYIRTAEQIVSHMQPVHETEPPRPKPEQKRVWASLEKPAKEIIKSAFEEAKRRDPKKTKHWVAVVDGNDHQLDLLEAYALEFGVTLIIILDIIHVLEYLWKAAYVFNEKESPQAQQWVSERLLEILEGRSSNVAAGIRRSATLRQLTRKQRDPADECADYLLKYGDYLRYDYYLPCGFPIASGVIEGACRHLIKDRLDLTGARWGLKGAEAVLKLRSLRSSGDFDEYWQFHLKMELQRNHMKMYANGILPVPTPSRSRIRLLK